MVVLSGFFPLNDAIVLWKYKAVARRCQNGIKLNYKIHSSTWALTFACTQKKTQNLSKPRTRAAHYSPESILTN